MNGWYQLFSVVKEQQKEVDVVFSAVKEKQKEVDAVDSVAADITKVI